MGLEEIRALKGKAKLPKEAKVYKIPKVSEKKKKELAEGKKTTASGELERWFNDRHKEMTGKCSNCGDKSCKGAANYKCSVAHILPKKLFKSVATHRLNWIELCFWGKSCHTNFDNHMLDITELNCFDEVIEKFVAMYPEIDKKERKYIPDALRQYILIDI